MDKEISEIIIGVREREIGIEVCKNILLYEVNIPTFLKDKVTEELIDILESVQCYLLEISVASQLIREILEKYEELH